MLWQLVLLPALLAALATLALTPAVIKLARRHRVVDVPGGRKKHHGEVPRLGGIAIFAGMLGGLIPGLWLVSGSVSGTLTLEEVVGVGLAVTIIFGLGIVDDVRGLAPGVKILVQILAASIIVFIGWQFTALRLPFEGRFYVGAVAPLLSVVWIVGITNAINLIDGLDGLAAGIVTIIASSLLVLALLQNRPETVLLTSCIAGACLGFLRHNWRPAKIYMGDSGALTLGFMLAAVTLRSSVKASATLAPMPRPILALGLPIFDTVLVMWYRFLRGHHKINRFARMLHADRSHLHHLLLETHTERSKVMLTLYGLAVGFCIMALVVAASGSLTLGFAFLGIEFAAIMLIRRAGLNAQARGLADTRLRRLENAEKSERTADPGGLPSPQVEHEVLTAESVVE